MGKRARSTVVPAIPPAMREVMNGVWRSFSGAMVPVVVYPTTLARPYNIVYCSVMGSAMREDGGWRGGSKWREPATRVWTVSLSTTMGFCYTSLERRG